MKSSNQSHTQIRGGKGGLNSQNSQTTTKQQDNHKEVTWKLVNKLPPQTPPRFIISLIGGRVLRVNETVADKVDQLLARNRPPKFFRVGTTRIASNQVATIMPEHVWQSMEKERNGQWQCDKGHWHTKDDKYCNIQQNKGLPSIVKDYIENPAYKPNSETARKWLALIRHNWQTYRESGKYGNLKDISELPKDFSTTSQTLY